MRPWRSWDHVLKIDPDKDLVDGDTFEDVCQTGTDALMIGGTTGITEQKMTDVLEACAAYDIPLYLEPNAPEVAIRDERLSGYLIPTVFNTANPFFLVGAHMDWIRMSDELPWEEITTQAYIVLNPDSAAATYTEANTDLTPEQVAAYATAADRLFGQDIVYLEYSGTFGDVDTVRAAKDAVDDGTIFYGGGIHDFKSAQTMGEVSDVVIVGDLVHDEGVDAVRETVAGAKQATQTH